MVILKRKCDLHYYEMLIVGFWATVEVLDTLLDQEGLEVDPIDRMERDTPLHKAVRFVNGLKKEEWETGASIPELLLDAGADPRFDPWYAAIWRARTDPDVLGYATKPS